MATTRYAKRGFASMPTLKRRNIASLGGIAAHVKGTAHQWTLEEARAAGSKGGKITAERKRVAKAARATMTTESAIATEAEATPVDA